MCPRSTREWAHRRIDQAKNHIDTAGMQLHEIADTYQNLHPEVSAPCEQILAIMLEILEILDGIRGYI